MVYFVNWHIFMLFNYLMSKFKTVSLQYIHGLAARGVHYFHRPGPILQDVGFFLLPVRDCHSIIFFRSPSKNLCIKMIKRSLTLYNTNIILDAATGAWARQSLHQWNTVHLYLCVLCLGKKLLPLFLRFHIFYIAMASQNIKTDAIFYCELPF